jgi:hypothetical protein
MQDLALLFRMSGSMVHIAYAIRAHFFGRDMHLLEEDSILSTRIILGRTVTTARPRGGDETPYQAIPSRIHATMYFVSLLQQHHLSEGTSLETCNSILEEILPVCYALIDSTNSNHAAIGITALIHLLDLTMILPLDSPANLDSVWNQFAEGTLSVLQLAFTACREGSIFVLIGQAQSRVFVQTRKCDRNRRQVSRQWLSKLHQGVHRKSSASSEVLWELLIGGIVPLLQQQAELPNADAMELGRLGLAALLPLISGETFVEESKVVMASLIALINLMMGAYPIMCHHGDKTITSLLVASCSESPEDDDDDGLPLLARHTAAIALVLCGGIQVVPVLQDMISGKECYENKMIQAALDVQRRAKILTEASC